MSIPLAWIMSAIDTVADFVRSALPLQYRHIASNWLIFACLFALAAALLAVSHFVFRDRPKIAWNFSKAGYPIQLGSSLATMDAQRAYSVDAIQLSGENVSGQDLYQVDGEIELRDGRKLPLFVVIDGAWRPLGELNKIPPRAMLYLGGSSALMVFIGMSFRPRCGSIVSSRSLVVSALPFRSTGLGGSGLTRWMIFAGRSKLKSA